VGWAAFLPSSPLHADRAVPRVGQVSVCVRCVRDVFDRRPHWPGRDANATSRRRCVVTAHGKAVAGSWRGTAWGTVRLGRGRVSWRRCARTRAGPGFLGPRRGRAMRRAPASWARSTTRRRGGDGGCGEDGGMTGPCTKRRHGGRRGKGGPTAGLQRAHRRRRQQGERKGNGGGEAHRRG
jgi:hypothetical protein